MAPCARRSAQPLAAMGGLIASAFGVLLDLLSFVFEAIRRVRVTVHVGYFPPSSQKHAFINVTNISMNRDVEIGAAWFELPKLVPVLNTDRPLPIVLKPGTSWETWISLDQLHGIHANRLYHAARVRLAGGRVAKSRRNTTVPPAGSPPGDSLHGS
jgi:hypothetical protein